MEKIERMRCRRCGKIVDEYDLTKRKWYCRTCDRYYARHELDELASPRPLGEEHQRQKEAPGHTVFVEVRFLKDTPIIMGVDMKQYGPFKKGDVAALPKENASMLIKIGDAERRYAPPKKPTLKELMKGEVLNGYIEAVRVKPLGAEVKLKGEDTARLADLFLDLLTNAGVSLPARFKSEFEEAMDIYKSYEENVPLIEEAAHRIIKRETGEEYPGAVMERIRKAREKAEKLIKKIREERGGHV